MKGRLTYCFLLVIAISCTKGGAVNDDSHNYPDPNDYTYPVVVVSTPVDDQVLANGSSIDVTGTVSDNSLFQGSISIRNENTASVVKDQYYEIHYIPSYNFSVSYVASVTTATDYTVTVKFEDHGHNQTVRTVKVKVMP